MTTQTFVAGEKIEKGEIVFASPATGLLMLVRPKDNFKCKNCDPAFYKPGKSTYLKSDGCCVDCGKYEGPPLKLENFEKSETDAAMAKYWLAKARYWERKREVEMEWMKENP